MRRRTATLAAVALGLAVGGVSPSATPAVKEPEADTVSLVRLLATPAAYDGKRVRVIGVAQVEFEWNLIYLNEDDYRHRVLPNAVGLSFGGAGSSARQRSYSGEYVVVEGTFKMRRQGTREREVGTIGSIASFERWELPLHSPPPSGQQ